MSHIVEITTALPAASPVSLDIVSMYGGEELGRLFKYTVSLQTVQQNAEAVEPESLLGTAMAISVQTGSGDPRYFHGVVSQFDQLGVSTDDKTAYVAVLRPWFWLLTRSANCRIFEDMTIPDIIKAVFTDNGFTEFTQGSAGAFEDLLQGTYEAQTYCAQYRETDFDFVSRLMEQEGIYYFFKYEVDNHVLVLTDDASCHEAVTNTSAVPVSDYALRFDGSGVGDGSAGYVVADVIQRATLQTGRYVLQDFDYTRSGTDLAVSQASALTFTQSDREVYDYSGGYTVHDVGERYALHRLEEQQTQYKIISADTDARPVSAGWKFSMTDHPTTTHNKEYLIIKATYQLYSNLAAGDFNAFFCSIESIDAQTNFRSARSTPKPIVQGPQTATVVDDAPASSDYVQVRARFHWDRGDKSSAWIRVAQSVAGDSWGHVSLPHIGQEVIVNFLEGDPDQPIITGRVYNDANMPPSLWDGSTSNIVFTDHVGNKFNLDGADSANPVIHITQPTGNQVKLEDNAANGPTVHISQPDGNEIKLENSKGVEIRDKFKNELVMSSEGIAQTSPWSTFNWTKASSDITVLGFSHSFFGGLKLTETVGLHNDIFIGFKFAEMLATSVSVALSATYSRTWGVSKTINKQNEYASKKDIAVKASEEITHDAPHQKYSTGKAFVDLKDDELLNKTPKAFMHLRSNGQVSLLGDGDMLLSTKKNLTLHASKSEIKLVGKDIKLSPSGSATINGQKIKIG